MKSTKRKYTVIDLANLRDHNIACLTLDLEQDYGDLLGEPSYEGLEHIPEFVEFFKARDIPLTCFVQGSLFQTHPGQIELLSVLDIEFELHSYSHPSPKRMNTKLEIEKGQEAYRGFFGTDPVGYRSPLGVIGERDYEILAHNGFKFDSGIIPSLRPGAFNNLRKPTKPYFVNNCKVVEFPCAVVSNVFRIPIALSYIRLLGKPYLGLLRILHLPRLIIFGFHLHDLFQLSSSKKIALEEFHPLYRAVFQKIYQRGGGLPVLDEVVRILKQKRYTFLKLADVYQSVVTQSMLASE